MTNAFATAFADYAPTLAADFVRYHTIRITNLIEQYEGKFMGLGNMFTNDGAYYREARGYIRSEGNTIGTIRAIGVHQERLAKDADTYAAATVASFVAKLTKKLESLSDVEVKRADGDTFIITGKLGSRSVSVHQDRILKTSPKGKLFHQWPARIYVNGNFTSEAAFKKLAA
jgi:hypothetical protein